MPSLPEARQGGRFLTRLLWTAALCLAAGGARAAAGGLPDFTTLVKTNSPAVVNISTNLKADEDASDEAPENGTDRAPPDFGPGDELNRRFFGEGQTPEDDQGGAPEDAPGSPEPQSLGSGFIIGADGFIVTNYHVVKGADEITVRLRDRRELPARLVGSDERSDLALLKVDAKGLPVVKIGHSRDLQVGEWVFAIGSPFGFDHSVSVGVVSATGRSLPSETYIPFIQTDVAINPGNSGGPLFNLKGEVVGINSQIYSRTGGFMGLSFAIPVDFAMDVVHQLKTKGHVVRGWLGVLIQDVNLKLSESLGMDRPVGALVLKVLPGSPADKAGVQVGDVVLDFAGHPIVTSSDLPVMVGRAPVDRPVTMHLLRGGKSLDLPVRVGKLPAKPELAMSPAAPAPLRNARLGIAVARLDDGRRKALGVEGKHGVWVAAVEPGPAQQAGVRRADVILMLNGADVDSTDDFRRLAAGLPSGRPVPILVQRDGGPLFLPLEVPDE
ncbi:MAG TPA: trypsin-like peptidase domain-containing protein [Gammaproteobacteria bacterium]|nr:trypsin-like peptidase domain-containing protein [Gammaproteobacteria bacterium]